MSVLDYPSNQPPPNQQPKTGHPQNHQPKTTHPQPLTHSPGDMVLHGLKHEFTIDYKVKIVVLIENIFVTLYIAAQHYIFNNISVKSKLV